MVRLIFVVALHSLLLACGAIQMEEGEGVANGKIVLSLDKGAISKAGGSSGGYGEDLWNNITVGSTSIMLDTNKFILSIYSAEGRKIYSGPYADRPDEIVVIPGSYDIKFHSDKYAAPWFDKPIFGDEQTVIVEAMSSSNVILGCKQLNSGIKLLFSSSFVGRFPNNIKLKDENGVTVYPKGSSGYMFVSPGKVELLYEKDGGGDTTLMTRTMLPAQMLTLNLLYSTEGAAGISRFKAVIDTTRVWAKERFNVALKTPIGVYSIWQAKNMVGEKGVSVFGYILGGDATNTTMRVGPPFESMTNLVIAPSMLERNRNNCFVVELTSGKVRDDLNLVIHPELLGRPIVLTGDIVPSYFGYVGIKKTKSYAFLN